MKKQQYYLIISLLLCIATKTQAQWEEPFSHYWELKGYYNPSFAGETDHINTSAVYHYKYTGLEYSPQRVVVTADMPFQFLQLRHGAGIVAYTENFGNLRNSLLGLQYSFRQQIGRGVLNFGIQAGMYNLNYDAGRVNLVPDTLLNNATQLNLKLKDKQVADLTAGISWTNNNFYAGLSVMHLNQPEFYEFTPDTKPESITNQLITNNTLESDSAGSFIPRTYNFIAGYNIGLFNSLEIEPMIWLLHDKEQTLTQATLRLEYDKRFSGGFSLISEAGYSIFAGATIQGFSFGYAYSAHNLGIGREGNYNHELYIRYDFPIYSFKSKFQPHKSIRLL